MKTATLLLVAILSIGCSNPVKIETEKEAVKYFSVISKNDTILLPTKCTLIDSVLEIMLEDDYNYVSIILPDFDSKIGLHNCIIQAQFQNNAYRSDRADILITEFSDVINCGISFRANDREYTINISDLSVIK